MAKKATKKEKQVIGYAIGIVLVVIFVLSIFRVGALGRVINNFIKFIFGDFYYIYAIIALLFAVKVYVFKNRRKLRFTIVFSLIFLCLGFLLANAVHYYGIYNSSANYTGFSIMSEVFGNLKKIASDEAVYYGGIFGALLFSLFSSILSPIGAKIICVLFFVLAVFVVIPLDFYKNASKYIKGFLHEARMEIKDLIIKSYAKNGKPIQQTQPINDLESVFEAPQEELEPVEEEIPVDQPIEDETEEIAEEEPEDEEAPEIITPKKTVHKANPFAGYTLPSMKLLEGAVAFKSDKNQQSAAAKGKKLIEVLRTFGIKSTLINTHIGPSVTKFEIKPDSTVNLNKIINLTDNIKMELAAKEVRIEAPIPGRNAVGIEIPNIENVSVKLSELLATYPKNLASNPLVFALGKDLMGQSVFCEINKMPHLLIGGATGSGKSVCINTIITSLLMRTRPDDVKLVLVDPKKVEFTPYHDVPHLLWPVITDSKMASNLLVKLVTIMKERFDLFSAVGVRDIKSYNQKVIENNSKSQDKMEKLPYIVCIIDELADLMLVAGKEVEASIQRLTQLARASGIHLIVATQRPSTDVITGLIKSNIPSRISFAVSSSIDSRTIIDQTGAERLLGNGDMLYLPQGENAPVRLQGCYVSDSEIQAITDAVKKFEPQYDDTYYQLERIKDEYNSSNDTDGGDDSLYEEAVEHIRKTQKASTSSLQRRFGIGYNRAARIIDTLEARGIIGPANGSKPREVYIKKENEEN